MDLCSGFRQIEGGWKASPVSAFVQPPSVQNNPYARVSYFRVAYSEPLHYTGIKMNMFVQLMRESGRCHYLCKGKVKKAQTYIEQSDIELNMQMEVILPPRPALPAWQGRRLNLCKTGQNLHVGCLQFTELKDDVQGENLVTWRNVLYTIHSFPLKY